MVWRVINGRSSKAAALPKFSHTYVNPISIRGGSLCPTIFVITPLKYLFDYNIIFLHTYNVLTYLADAGSPAAVVAMASASASTGNGVVPVANVSGLLGRSARLPCDTTPPSPDNPLLLVIWFKEPSPDPIYRYLFRI